MRGKVLSTAVSLRPAGLDVQLRCMSGLGVQNFVGVHGHRVRLASTPSAVAAWLFIFFLTGAFLWSYFSFPLVLARVAVAFTLAVARPRFHARLTQLGGGDVRAGELFIEHVAPVLVLVLCWSPPLVGRSSSWPSLISVTVVLAGPGFATSEPGEELAAVPRGVRPHTTRP